MAATLGGINLGDVTSETQAKNSGLFNLPLPYSDSSDVLIMDLFGTSRIITIEGVKTGVVADLRTFITNIEAIQNGEQSGSTFVSSWTNANKTVLIQDFSYTKSEADENKLTYSLTLIEGTVL